MFQYSSLEDALFSLLNEYGLPLMENPRRLIALLSDYMPELMSQQQTVRKYIRAGGNLALLTTLRDKCPRSNALPKLYEAGAHAQLDIDDLKTVVHSVENLLRKYNSNYDEELTAEQLYESGMHFFRQVPRDKNIPVAICLLCEAGEKGSAKAFLRVANCFLKGKGIAKDVALGMKYLELAAGNRSPIAILELAEHYAHGKDAEKNLTRAEKLLQQVQQMPEAQLLLGEIYTAEGLLERAFQSFVNAAEKENAQGQYETALCYATGRGIKRDMQKAKKWLKAAARFGHSEAREKLEELGESWNL